MIFALVDGERRTPTKGARAVCECCAAEVVAKCGRIKMWHWAHMPKASCDPWRDGETEWHLEWKGLFPEAWCEVVHVDEKTGEKHIADVKTPSGLVVEFQHSPLDYDEMVSREAFYRNMIWVVDGDRGTNDPGTFRVGFSSHPVSLCPVIHSVGWWSQSRLLERWSAASAPVYIDFGWGGLWRLHDFTAPNGPAHVSPLRVQWLVEACERGEPIPLLCIREEQRDEYASQYDLQQVQ